MLVIYLQIWDLTNKLYRKTIYINHQLVLCNCRYLELGCSKRLIMWSIYKIYLELKRFENSWMLLLEIVIWFMRLMQGIWTLLLKVVPSWVISLHSRFISTSNQCTPMEQNIATTQTCVPKTPTKTPLKKQQTLHQKAAHCPQNHVNSSSK